MPRIWSVSDLADRVGASRQTVWARHKLGLLPSAQYYSGQGTPYWSDAQADEIARNWRADLRHSQ